MKRVLLLSSALGGLLVANSAFAQQTTFMYDALEDTYSVAPGATATLPVAANDIAPNPFTLTLSNQPLMGTAQVVGNEIEITADANATGSSDFVYVLEGGGEQHTAIVTINFETPNTDPVAVDDKVVTDLDTPVNFDVLADNGSGVDSDAEGPVTYLGVTAQPTNGILTDNFDGTFTYEPNPGFVGADSFTYAISDDLDATAEATVSIMIMDVPMQGNTLPVAVNDGVMTDFDTPITVDAIINDSDPDNDPIIIVDVEPGQNGAQIDLNQDGTITFTPAAGFVGDYSFGYLIQDINGGQAQATVTVTVKAPPAPVNNPPVAVIDEVITPFETAVNIIAIANDSDPDGDAIAIVAIMQAANGTVVNNVDGSLTYTPAAGFEGTDTFKYLLEDANGGQAEGIVNIIVEAAPQPAVVVPEALATKLLGIGATNTGRNISSAIHSRRTRGGLARINLRAQNTSGVRGSFQANRVLGEIVCSDGSRFPAGSNPWRPTDFRVVNTSVQTGAVQAGTVQQGGVQQGVTNGGGFPVNGVPVGGVALAGFPNGNLPAGNLPVGSLPAGGLVQTGLTGSIQQNVQGIAQQAVTGGIVQSGVFGQQVQEQVGGWQPILASQPTGSVTTFQDQQSAGAIPTLWDADAAAQINSSSLCVPRKKRAVRACVATPVPAPYAAGYASQANSIGSQAYASVLGGYSGAAGYQVGGYNYGTIVNANYATQPIVQQQTIRKSYQANKSCYQTVKTYYTDQNGNQVSKADFEAAQAGGFDQGFEQQVVETGTRNGLGFDVWASNDFTNLSSAFAGDTFSGAHNQAMIGADYAFRGGFIVGGAAGLETAELTSDLKYKLNTRATMLNLYGANRGKFNSGHYSFDVFAGYGLSNYKIENPYGEIGEASGRRLQGGLNGALTYLLGAIEMTGNGGLAFAQDNIEGYTDSYGNVVGAQVLRTTKANVGGRVGYSIGGNRGYGGVSLVPYLSAELEADLSGNSNSFEAEVGGGVAVAFSENGTLDASFGYGGLGAEGHRKIRASVLANFQF